MDNISQELENMIVNSFDCNTNNVFKTNEEKAEYITNLLSRGRFRKAKLEEGTRKNMYDKILLSINNNIPLHFIVCFGGYKHFWNESYPKVDYAELFNLMFFSEYFSVILKLHIPGVILEYGAEDVVLDLMNNYPREDLISYEQSFKDLIKFYSKYIPSNFEIKYTSTKEKYNREDLVKFILEKLAKCEKEWENFSDIEKEENLHRSKRSIMWKGEEDWTNLNEEERNKKYIRSRCIDVLFCDNEVNFIGDYYDGENRIPVVLTWGLSFDNKEVNWLTLGSTFSSTVDFWIGRGILERHENKFVPRIVSATQYDKIKCKLIKVDIDCISLDNFKKLEIYDGIINFNN